MICVGGTSGPQFTLGTILCWLRRTRRRRRRRRGRGEGGVKGEEEKRKRRSRSGGGGETRWNRTDEPQSLVIQAEVGQAGVAL